MTLEIGAATHQTGIERLGIDPPQLLMNTGIAGDHLAAAPAEHRCLPTGWVSGAVLAAEAVVPPTQPCDIFLHSRPGPIGLS